MARLRGTGFILKSCTVGLGSVLDHFWVNSRTRPSDVLNRCHEGRFLRIMRNPNKPLGLLALIALLISTNGAFAATQTVPFSLNGSGSLTGSPVVFQGIIDSGPFSSGQFLIEINDYGWPLDNPGTPENERWDYLLANFFTYDNSPGGEHWDGYFPAQGGQIPVVVWSFTKGADRVGGIIRYLIITIRDDDADALVDQDELANQAVAANLQVHIEQSAGSYDGWCGFGPANGNLENYDPYMDDLLTIPVGNLYLRDVSCTVPIEESSWGAVKKIYR